MKINKIYYVQKRKIIKQYLFRVQYSKTEIFYKLLKILISNKYLTKQIKVIGIFYLTFLIHNQTIVKQKNICLQSGLTRSVHNKVGLNRGFFREYISQGKLPGYQPAKW